MGEIHQENMKRVLEDEIDHPVVTTRLKNKAILERVL